MALSPTSSHPGIPSGGTAGGDLTGTYPNPTFDLTKTHVYSGNQTAPALVASGLTGSVAASRYVGGVATVAPTTGTFAVGDFVIAQNGGVFVCTAAGTPGTWGAVGGSSSPVTFVQLPISSAQILASGLTPVELVAAPGAGKLLIAAEVWYEFVFVTSGYTDPDGPALYYGNNAGTKAGFGPDLTGSASDVERSGANLFPSPASLSSVSNKAIVYQSGGVAPTGGDSTLRVFLSYYTATL